MVLDARSMENCEVRFLILSDGRMGHLNQSIAFAKHANATYEIVPVIFTCKFSKILSYLFDFLHIYSTVLFKLEKPLLQKFDAIVSAGSSTYYANKTLSRICGFKSITMMLPKGYRYDFDVIFAQTHDNPPLRKNIISLPANMSFTQPQGLFSPLKPSIGIIIGGNNAIFTMDAGKLKTQLDSIAQKFKDYDIALTTSPRTPLHIEKLLEDYHFAYTVIFSHHKINPIADFLHHCKTVFITMDSTSMISEAISYGNANVEILPLNDAQDNKFYAMVENLEKQEFLHIFDGTVAGKNKKIDFGIMAQKGLDLV